MQPLPLSEKQLIINCKRHIKTSQFELVKRYSSMLMAVSLRYVTDKESAKDVLQEAFITIFSNIHNYQPIGSFEAWMRKITIRCALHWLRKHDFQNRKNRLIVEDRNQKSVEPEIYATFDKAEIQNLINELPYGFRTVFNLNVIEGYSHKEISELLNIKESASRSQLSRARKLLQSKIVSGPYKRKLI